MNIHETGIERLRGPVEPVIVPAHEWVDPAQREAVEEYYKCKVAPLVHVFDARQYRYLLSSPCFFGTALRPMQGMGEGGKARFRVLCGEWIDREKRVRDGGYLLIGADSRVEAEAYQLKYIARVNEELAHERADFRLWVPS